MPFPVTSSIAGSDPSAAPPTTTWAAPVAATSAGSASMRARKAFVEIGIHRHRHGAPVGERDAGAVIEGQRVVRGQGDLQHLTPGRQIPQVVAVRFLGVGAWSRGSPPRVIVRPESGLPAISILTSTRSKAPLAASATPRAAMPALPARLRRVLRAEAVDAHMVRQHGRPRLRAPGHRRPPGCEVFRMPMSSAAMASSSRSMDAGQASGAMVGEARQRAGSSPRRDPESGAPPPRRNRPGAARRAHGPLPAAAAALALFEAISPSHAGGSVQQEHVIHRPRSGSSFGPAKASQTSPPIASASR